MNGDSGGGDGDDGDNHHHEPTAGEVASGKLASLLHSVGQIPLSTVLQRTNQALSIAGGVASLVAFGLAAVGVAPAVVAVLSGAAVVAGVLGVGVTIWQWARGDVSRTEAITSIGLNGLGVATGLLGRSVTTLKAADMTLGEMSKIPFAKTIQQAAFVQSRSYSMVSATIASGQLVGGR